MASLGGDDPGGIKPRPASTVLIYRTVDLAPEDAHPLEVLMLKRNPRSEFVSGAYVFPGGAVDAADESLADRCWGVEPQDADRRLGLDSGGLAFFVAAIREVFEESGILLAREESGETWDPTATGREARMGAARASLNEGQTSFAEIVESEAVLLDAAALIYFAHWITPPGPPRRYDTRFFIAAAPEGQVAEHEGIEAVDSRWIHPREALTQIAAGEMTAIFPTIKTLESVAGFDTFSDLAGWGAAREVETVRPRIVEGAGGIQVLVPGDEGYEEAPA